MCACMSDRKTLDSQLVTVQRLVRNFSSRLRQRLRHFRDLTSHSADIRGIVSIGIYRRHGKVQRSERETSNRTGLWSCPLDS